MDLHIFSHQLIELRKERNLTQEELGKLIGVSKVSICHYENGIQFPTLDKLLLLIYYFLLILIKLMLFIDLEF